MVTEAEAEPEEAAPSAPMDMDGEMESGSGLAAGLAAGKARGSLGYADESEKDDRDDPAGSEVASVRRWFPEAFLWEPLVQTDEQGVATLSARVPDRLTGWRVLALAHDRSGQQAGAVHTVQTRLPFHVDPVVPGWLSAGDRLWLPVQATNGTDAPLYATVGVAASGALSGWSQAGMQLTAGSTDVRLLLVQANTAGSATVTTTGTGAGHQDSTERQIRVVPAGRPMVASRGSTLSSERTFRLPGPSGASAATEEVEILVFPGPLAALQAELRRVAAGAGPRDGAYAFALSSRLAALSDRVGAAVEQAAVRRLQILAWQRIAGVAAAPDPGQAADLATAIADVDGVELVTELRGRLHRRVREAQRADGTWSRRGTSTLQRVLVDTAVAARSLPADATGARLRASGAVERHAEQVDDPFTASVILAAGLAQGPASDRLLGLLTDSLSPHPTGAMTVADPGTAVSAQGARPSRSEVLAWAVLALPEDHEARGDLVGELMGRWSAQVGFGAGAADVLALEAIVRGMPGTGQEVDVILEVQGAAVAQQRLDPAQPHVPAVLQYRPEGRDTPLRLRAVPSTPGLSFVATRRSWVPWSAADEVAGVDVEVDLGRLVVGQSSQVKLSLAAPSGSRLTIEQGLPAGAQVDATGESGVEVFTDRVRITTGRFRAGEVLQVVLQVTPAFAGQFQTGPMTVAVDGGPPAALRPAVWTVARGR